MREGYGGRLRLRQMKIPTQIAYSLEMNEYEIGGDNFHDDKDVTGGDDSDEFEQDFYNGIDENGEVSAEDDDGAEDDVYRQLAQKDKDLLLAAELGKALLEKNEELSHKYELLQEEYSQVVEVRSLNYFWSVFVCARKFVLSWEQVVIKFTYGRMNFITRKI